MAAPPQSRVGAGAGHHRHGRSGKSSLTDELLLRLRLDQEDKVAVAVLAVDPRTGAVRRRAARRSDPHERVGGSGRGVLPFGGDPRRRRELPAALPAMVEACRVGGFDLVVVETPGIGQGDAAIVALADVSLYVMTPEFGAASQLEKIDMFDFADAVAINKFERRAARTRSAMSAVRWPATGSCSASTRRRCRCSGRWPPGSTTTG